ncbi:MAG: hypothetical protein ACREJP_02805 [Candidatus Methylomirabilales bacterium]
MSAQLNERRERIVTYLAALRRHDLEGARRVLSEEDDVGDFVLGLAQLCLYLIELFAEEAGVEAEEVLRHLGFVEKKGE